MVIKEEHKVAGLLAVALFSQLFLFSVALTNCSFQQEEFAMPSIFAPSQISATLNNKMNIIGENLNWSVSTAYSSVKPKVLSFLGLQGPQFTSNSTALAQQTVPDTAPQVLGAFTQNNAFNYSQ